MEETQAAIAALGAAGKFPKLVTLSGNVCDALQAAYDLGPGEGMSAEAYAALGVALANFKSAQSAFAISAGC
jgi:hypothetical protein